jgi:LmbE family N-acetylglucosaminyl deacetylase
VLISPHSDDVAYSVGGAILSEFFPRPLLIITPFTASISGAYISGEHDVERVSRLRAAEDDAFALEVGSRVLRFNLPEASLSSKTGAYFFPLVASASLLCGWPPPRNRVGQGIRRIASRTPLTLRSEFLHRLARLEGLRAVLKERITHVLNQCPEAILVSPIGLGNNPNHISLACVCRSLRKDVPQLYFYEDLPYAARYSLRGIERYVALFDGRLRPVVVNIEGAADGKVKNLLGYRSQVGPLEIEKVRANARRLSSGRLSQERLWTYPM